MRVFFYRISISRCRPLPFLRDDDRMTDVLVEEFEALDDPRIEPTVNVRLHFFHEVLTVLQPRQIGAWCGGKNRVFTFFAVESVMHRSVGTASSSDSPAPEKKTARRYATGRKHEPSLASRFRQPSERTVERR